MKIRKQSTTSTDVLCAVALVLSSALAGCVAHGPRELRIVVEGQQLVAVNGTRVVLKELGIYAEFEGYGLVAEDTLFAAWSSDTEGGASTLISLFDLASGKEHFLCELGGTGETTFAVNRAAGLVAFNWDEAIYAVRVRDLLMRRDGGIDCLALQRRFIRLLPCRSCYEPQWMNASRLAYSELDGDAPVTKQIELGDVLPEDR
jgi:hypothetical protein